ncbi:MAG TPA: MFS transporter [Cellulomonas sp.]
MTTRSVAAGDPPRLHRDRFTVTMYGYFIAWGWFLYSFNPSVPLLAKDLGISNAAAGLHGTAMAVGAIVAAALTPRLVLRLGRRASLVLAGLLLGAGLVVLLTGGVLAATLAGVVLLAIGGNMAISAAQAGLALHHGRAASAAVTEGNASGSGIGLLGPLAVGACVAAGWGWRPAVAVTVGLAVVAVLATRRLPMEGALARALPGRDAARVAAAELLPGAETELLPGAEVRAAADREAGGDSPTGRVPTGGGAADEGDDGGPAGTRSARSAAAARLASRWFLVTIVAAIALENATTYWATDLVIDRTGAGAGIAAATTAGLVAGMTAIRLVAGPLSLRVPPARLLAAAFGVAVVGWAILWTATAAWVALLGLFVAGLGYGVHYPLGIALLLGASGGATDRAQARATVAGGAAIGVAPFLLGALADGVGAHTAFLVVPVVAVVGGLAAVAGARALRGMVTTA